MSTNPSDEPIFERIDPARREAVRKMFLGAAIYAAPVVASFSMENLGGVAHAQSGNQVTAVIPTTTPWGLAAIAGGIGTAAAIWLRKRRK